MKKGKRQRTKRPAEVLKWEHMPVVNAHAAGLDIGAEEIMACAPQGDGTVAVRAFGTFTPDLEALAEWLVECGVKSVAMESTGVYWIPVYAVLEARGLEVCLVNARHVKNVPGRKSDVQDCVWLQRLHAYGLLSASFRPAADLRAVRTYVRHRASLIEYRAAHIQHMQKALLQMNLQLTQVLSDITGVTGLAILRAIVAGQHDPVELARLRHARCQSSEDDIAKALTGHYQAEHLFTLRQALALYDFYTSQIQACDAQLEQHYSAIKPVFDDDPEQPLPPLPPDRKHNSHSKNAPTFDVREQLYRILGVDLTDIDGLDDSSAQEILAVIGTDMTAWPTVKHFCSWLGLAPHHDITGGKIIRRRTLPVHNRAATVLRLAAQAVGKTDTALGGFYRRLKARLGAPKAITATAHKLARIIYHVLKFHQAYQPQSLADYEARTHNRELKALQRRADKLGLQLVPRSASPTAA